MTQPLLEHPLIDDSMPTQPWTCPVCGREYRGFVLWPRPPHDSTIGRMPTVKESVRMEKARKKEYEATGWCHRCSV